MRNTKYVKKKMIEATGVAKVIDANDEYVEIPFATILTKPDTEELMLKLKKQYKYASVIKYEFNDITMQMELDKFIQFASYVSPHKDNGMEA